MLDNIRNREISNQNNIYYDIILQIYTEIISELNREELGYEYLSKDFEEYILQNIIGTSKLNSTLKNKLKKTFLNKLLTARNKTKKLELFQIEKLSDLDTTIETEEDEELKKLLLLIKNGNGFYKRKGPILAFISKKEKILEFLSSSSDISGINDIGFFIKDSQKKYGFDIVVANNTDILEHEYRESILELFTDEKVKKISLFNLVNEFKNNHSYNQIFNGILTDILTHLAATEKGSFFIVVEIEKYQKFVSIAMKKYQNNTNYYNVLFEVEIFLNYLYKIISNLNNSLINQTSNIGNHELQDKIYKGLIGNLNTPQKLLASLTDGNIDFEQIKEIQNTIKNEISKQDEITSKTDYEVFNILSNSSLDLRYCTIVTHRVKEVLIEKSTCKNKRIIVTPLNIENKNLEYLLTLYLSNLKKSGQIKNYFGDIKEKLFIEAIDGKQNEIIINSDGFISFEVDTLVTVKQEVEVEMEVKDEMWLGEVYSHLGKKEIDRTILNQEKISEERVGLSDKDINDITDEIQELEKTKNKELSAKIDEFDIEIDLELSELMDEISEKIKADIEDINLESDDEILQDEDQTHNYLFTFYETAITDSIEEINKSLKFQYKNADKDYEKYLYSMLEGLTTIRESSDTIIKRIVFDRQYEIGEESPDKVEIDIIYNKKTGKIHIRKDWQGMCSAHQVIDATLEKILNQRWGLDARRVDQKGQTQNMRTIQKMKEDLLQH